MFIRALLDSRLPCSHSRPHCEARLLSGCQHHSPLCLPESAQLPCTPQSVEATTPLANESLHCCSKSWWLPCSPLRAAQLGKATIQLATDSLQWAEEQRQRLDERQQQQEQAQLNGFAAGDGMDHSEAEVRRLLHQSAQRRVPVQAACSNKAVHPVLPSGLPAQIWCLATER